MMSRPVYRKPKIPGAGSVGLHGTRKQWRRGGTVPRRKAIVRPCGAGPPGSASASTSTMAGGLNQQAIAKLLEVNVSTVSRNISNGERHAGGPGAAGGLTSFSLNHVTAGRTCFHPVRPAVLLIHQNRPSRWVTPLAMV